MRAKKVIVGVAISAMLISSSIPVIQLKIITHMSRMEMVLFRVQMLVKVIGLKLRLLIKEIVLPTVIATKQRFGIMAEWLEFQPLFFVECI